MATRYEYSGKEALEGDASAYFRVPLRVICDGGSDPIRVSAFCALSIMRGMTNRLTFNANMMASWLNRRPDRHVGGVNDRICSALSKLRDDGYLSFDGDIGNSSMVESRLDMARVAHECHERLFAVVYADEFDVIMGLDSKSRDAVLVVFAWLRMRIPRRRNELSIDEDGDISDRRRTRPDAFDCRYEDIAYETGLSARVVSKSVDALQELGLIYHEAAKRRMVNGRWVTGNTIFCNMYKREMGFLLASGEGYYVEEVSNKREKLMRMIGR